MRHFLASLIVFSHLLLPVATHASGSFVRRPPKPPKQRQRILYTLGKDIYNGKVALQSQGGSRFKKELSEFQEQLPENAKMTVDLPAMSGMLTDEQMEALAFYLFKRHKVQ